MYWTYLTESALGLNYFDDRNKRYDGNSNEGDHPPTGNGPEWESVGPVIGDV